MTRLAAHVLIALSLFGCSSEPSIDDAPETSVDRETSPDTEPEETVADSATSEASTDAGDAADTAPPLPADTGPVTYTVEARTLTSSGESRAYTLAKPPVPKGAQLVIAFHGDGGNGPSFRTALNLESATSRPTVFAYPTAPGGTFGYWDDAGRTKEAQFVRDLVSALATELGIDKTRVFLTGFSGGATLTNALACRLGPSVVRGVGVHSGTLYPVTTSGGKMDFDYDSKGAPTCALPPALLVWGALDKGDTSFAYGQNTRDGYRAKNACASTTKAASVSPCVVYDGCAVTWCAIDGMGHALWSSAGRAIQGWFDTR